jgi:3-hydroxyacyl-CoA dehydrogenase
MRSGGGGGGGSRLDVKPGKAVCRTGSCIVGPDAVLATNTSSLSVTAIAAG